MLVRRCLLVEGLLSIRVCRRGRYHLVVPPAVPDAFRSDWSRLWTLAERIAPGVDHAGYTFGEPIGLFLEDPGALGHDGGYRSSPANGTMFASTGGDGVHFSVLDSSGAVVMTVPMAFRRPNLIVAEGMPEFLALGCRVGYFALEELIYRRSWAVEWIAAAGPPKESTSGRFLSAIIEEFALRPWQSIEQRLAELEASHARRIRLA